MRVFSLLWRVAVPGADLDRPGEEDYTSPIVAPGTAKI